MPCGRHWLCSRPTWRCAQPRPAELDRRFAIGFVVVELIFITTHYYAVLLLPVHALILFTWLARRNLARALIAAAVLLVVGSLVGAYGAYTIFAQGGGQNFASISLSMLVPDLLNAFSLGLSVDLARVWWIDWVFGVLALAGAVWGLRSRQAAAAGGWVLPAFFLVPIAILLVLNEFRPLYMNARHLSLLVGAFILLSGGGLALLWRWQRWAGGLADAGAGGSHRLQHGQLLHTGRVRQGRLQELWQLSIHPHHAGRRRLFYPPSSWRIFEYYVPSTTAAGGIQAERTGRQAHRHLRNSTVRPQHG